MINQVRIQNFKCLRDVTVDLERFTVFVGANGSGKTSVLQALDMLCRAFRSPQGDWEGEFRQRRSRGAKDEVEVAAVCDGTQYRFRTQGEPVCSIRGARGAGAEVNLSPLRGRSGRRILCNRTRCRSRCCCNLKRPPALHRAGLEKPPCKNRCVSEWWQQWRHWKQRSSKR